MDEDTIMTLIRCFAGRELSQEEETALLALSQAAEKDWESRLLAGVTRADCADAFDVACAWTALAGMAGAEALTQPKSFTAGDLTIVRGDQGNTCAQSLLQQANCLMAPYTRDLDFVFQGVRG